jgi:hypothetical protein
VSRFTLGLSETTREVFPDAPESRTIRHFLDFTLDGAPLYPRVRALGFDLITPLWVRNPLSADGAREAVDRLLGLVPPDAPGNRVSVFRCAECGELGCGALTVELTLTDESVGWSSWGYQNDYDGELWQEEASDLPEAAFDRADYEETLRVARGHIDEGA